MIDSSKIILTPTKVFYLKMDEQPSERLTVQPDISFKTLTKTIDTDEYLKYYGTVGFQFNWLDRLVMPSAELKAKINAENVHIHVMSVGGEEAGYLELQRESEYVELLYFGLFPAFIGKGLGKYFLDWSIHKAWSYNPQWIQLNTCEHDHDNALPTYRKLGFKDYKTAIEQRRIQMR